MRDLREQREGANTVAPGSARVMHPVAEHLRRHEHDALLGHVEALAVLDRVDADLRPRLEPALPVEDHAPEDAVPPDLDARAARPRPRSCR